MLKKTFTYIDYNDEKVTEECYFNFTKAELADMTVSTGEGLGTKIKRIIDAKDKKEIVSILQEIILKSYGEKSDDGKRFMKSDEIRANFKCSEPYSMLYMELCTNAEAAAAFIKGVLPKDIAEKVDMQAIEMPDLPVGIS